MRDRTSSLRREASLLVRRLLGALMPSVVEPIRANFPAGHFYSPVVDPREVQDGPRLWAESPHIIGIDFNDSGHVDLLNGPLREASRDFDYPHEASPGGGAYYTDNQQFGWLDSRVLFALLRIWRPRRIVEVGSGFSTLLMAEVNRRFLDGGCDITCIEPFPRGFLKELEGIDLLPSVVQSVPLARFETLEAGDVLFIDSSHVAKTGSDVNWLVFEVLPRLRPGVLVHFHDVFLPSEYPRDWVVKENRSWNEQYLLRALLMYSTAFTVVFGCAYACARHPALVQSAFEWPEPRPCAGGSFWITRT